MPEPTPRPSLTRRGCALLALATATAAPLVVITLLLRHPAQLVLTLVLAALALAAAWAALVHRGVRRLLATALAAVALAAPWALPDLRAYPVALVVLGLVVGSTLLARVAIGRATSPAGVAVGPARHGVLLLNPHSGGGKVARFALAAQARQRGVLPVQLRPGDDLRALAEQAVAGGADVLGMAGGDGSQALVADIAHRHDLPFVCVPAGTRNHFARDLGLDRDDVVGALNAYGPACEHRIDLALLGDRVFVNNASLGVYATIVQADTYREAKLATTTAALPDLLGPHTNRPDLRFTRPDGTEQPGADIILISNGTYRLDHLNGLGRRERLDTATLGIITISINHATQIPTLIAAEMSGHLTRFPGYTSWTTPHFTVTSTQPLIDVGIDGEALQLPPPLCFRSLPGALRVRLPTHTQPPPTPIGTGKTISTLLTVLMGRTEAPKS